jgi:hypothetical protein
MKNAGETTTTTAMHPPSQKPLYAAAKRANQTARKKALLKALNVMASKPRMLFAPDFHKPGPIINGDAANNDIDNANREWRAAIFG